MRISSNVSSTGPTGLQSKREEARGQREKDEEEGMCRTKRNKVNSEAHLAVLPSNLGSVPARCKKLGRLACTDPCYRQLKLDRRRGKKSAANIWSMYLDRVGEESESKYYKMYKIVSSMIPTTFPNLIYKSSTKLHSLSQVPQKNTREHI